MDPDAVHRDVDGSQRPSGREEGSGWQICQKHIRLLRLMKGFESSSNAFYHLAKRDTGCTEWESYASVVGTWYFQLRNKSKNSL